MGCIPKIHIQISAILAAVAILSSVATLGGNTAFARSDIPDNMLALLTGLKGLGSSVLGVGRGINNHIPSGFENIKEHIASMRDRAQTVWIMLLKINSQNKYDFLAFYIWILINHYYKKAVFLNPIRLFLKQIVIVVNNE